MVLGGVVGVAGGFRVVRERDDGGEAYDPVKGIVVVVVVDEVWFGLLELLLSWQMFESVVNGAARQQERKGGVYEWSSSRGT